mmetsp:Transcript_36106/g.41105  ORF Transcript_36106/g.41105 Transcript_36106/m.41105 type:complete len:88 (+) Transcript_36106:600-863(+)
MPDVSSMTPDEPHAMFHFENVCSGAEYREESQTRFEEVKFQGKKRKVEHSSFFLSVKLLRFYEEEDCPRASRIAGFLVFFCKIFSSG